MSESKNEKPNLGHSPEKVFIYAHNVELLQQCILQMCESSEWPRYISTRLRNSILSGLKRNEVSFILRYALRIQHSVNEAKDLVFKDLAFKNFTLLDTANREALAWMFSYISPAVCDGFTIVAELEDGKFIRYLFKNGKCIIEEGGPIFPSDLQYVVIKRIYDDYHNAGIEVCGVYTREVDAQNRLIDEASKAIQFLNENADKYPARFWQFGNENYWTVAEKKVGTTRNIIDISIYKANSLPLKNENKEIQK